MASETFIAGSARAILSRVDAIVFDIDGVLVDVCDSYPSVIAEAARFYLTKFAGIELAPEDEPITHGEIPLFKRASGFNDDWAIAKSVVRLSVMKSARSGVRGFRVLGLQSPTIRARAARSRATFRDPAPDR